MITKRVLLTMTLPLIFFLFFACDSIADSVQEVPVKGMVTMIDLGAKKCIPCKMMIPIMQNIETAYKGKAAIVFIDVWEHRNQTTRFGIRLIPTQIFFDKAGKEVYRHEGFMKEAAIVGQLEKIGVEKVLENKDEQSRRTED